MLAVDAVKVLLISATLAAEPAPNAPEATLQVANRAVFTFRATSGGVPPAERLALARSRVEGIPPAQLGDEVSTRPLQVGSEKATAIFHGPRFLFQVAEGDVDPAAGETTASVAKKTAAALQQALQAQQEQRSIRFRQEGGGDADDSDVDGRAGGDALSRLRR